MASTSRAQVAPLLRSSRLCTSHHNSRSFYDLRGPHAPEQQREIFGKNYKVKTKERNPTGWARRGSRNLPNAYEQARIRTREEVKAIQQYHIDRKIAEWEKEREQTAASLIDMQKAAIQALQEKQKAKAARDSSFVQRRERELEFKIQKGGSWRNELGLSHRGQRSRSSNPRQAISRHSQVLPRNTQHSTLRHSPSRSSGNRIAENQGQAWKRDEGSRKFGTLASSSILSSLSPPLPSLRSYHAHPRLNAPSYPKAPSNPRRSSPPPHEHSLSSNTLRDNIVRDWDRRFTPRENPQRPRPPKPSSEPALSPSSSPSQSAWSFKEKRVYPPKPKIPINPGGLPQLTEFYRPPPSSRHERYGMSISSRKTLDPKPQAKTPELKGMAAKVTEFTSPPLLPGLVSSLHDVLGLHAVPTEIQKMSIARVVERPPGVGGGPPQKMGPREYLLASETGSGKSFAYLLPLLQSLKLAELARQSSFSSTHAYNPRSLILAPTHELARQLAGFAKTLSHGIKLKVVCASRANERNRDKDREGSNTGPNAHLHSPPTLEPSLNNRRPVSRSIESFDGQITETEGEVLGDGIMELDVRPTSAAMTSDADANAALTMSGPTTRPVDVLVGTPMKLLEMVFGRGWDREEKDQYDAKGKRWPRAKPEMGLANIEWVVVDEADVLFDPDFHRYTRMLLSEISKAKGREVTFVPEDPALSTTSYPYPESTSDEEDGETDSEDKVASLSSASTSSPTTSDSTPVSGSTPLKYPFNMLLTTATIPPALSLYLSTNHPSMVRLSSSGLHRLPTNLQIEHVNWSGGNKLADIEKRLRGVWMEDERRWLSGGDGNPELSKVVVFCNKSTKVDQLGEYLEKKGIKTVGLTSKINEEGEGISLGPESESQEKWNANSQNGVGHAENDAEGEESAKKEKGPVSERRWGSNKHLQGFLRVNKSSARSPESTQTQRSTPPPASALSTIPHVLITTSLLSRGLDFSPLVRHVFIVDEPRNVVDFLHRAGRTGRAGGEGVVVVFGKGGRGMGTMKKGREPLGWRGGKRGSASVVDSVR
ncbi:hypothetical protein BDP27DRAFT_1348096 [Rhodocollybia butyracea]|uniref:RNA helicase n=1 Tax=Rhodocollybia butyracea TaxID=206335 RepID=A0A9P5TWG6_9AGAR|nr:hypothetical protein BDP27DRAFT_1348096 [Rhodocollybia butyracea]